MTELSHEEVLQILEAIEKSEFDFFELRLGDLKLTVSKTAAGALGVPRVTEAGGQPPAPARQLETGAVGWGDPAPTASPAPISEIDVGDETRHEATAAAGSTEGLVEVKAPIVGTFYAQPEPGAPPYVEIGSQVKEDTTLGLIEVMKVFNAVPAGVSGVVERILVRNAEFVEFGQPLFLIRPAASGRRPGTGAREPA